MGSVKVRREKIAIKTYPVGEPEKNPMFFEKRVYQGSCGKVYPVPFIDKVYDTPSMKDYDAVTLENEYVRLVLLPELGGRIGDVGRYEDALKVLALAALGRKKDAKALFKGMKAFADKGLKTPFKIDYFATSLPLLLIFDDDLEAVKNERMRKLVALAEKGAATLAAASRGA